MLEKTPNFNALKLQSWKFRYPLFFALIEKIHNLYYDTGIHPSGIIVAERSLIGLVPVQKEKNFLLTLYEEPELAQLGLKKYDFLSLKETLGFITDIKSLNFLSEVKGNLQIKLPSYQEVDLNDPKT